MIAKRHPFSIDYITSAAYADVESAAQCGRDAKTDLNNFVEYKSSVSGSRQTPSPSDSGLESDHSPAKTTGQATVSQAYNIPDTIRSLEKAAASVSAPKTTDTTASSSNGNDKSTMKPPHSYIALISMAILSARDRKMLLCDIYKYIMDTFDYYNNEDRAWRNSIRHNLSLNECFIKAGRSDNGKGNYWAIHPACETNFSNGDFRRRQARRRARKSLTGSSSHSSHGISSGYVPMTASHVSFHPYVKTEVATSYNEIPLHSPSLQDSFPSPPMRPSSIGQYQAPATLCRSESVQSTGSQSSDGVPFYRSGGSGGDSHSISSRAMSVAAQQFWAQQSSNAMQTMQALTHQQFASSFQYQHWP